ncbi:MAG TPA: winged helix DNA-binding domain-containing protein [Candidatus Limnocylindrales bacterium]
MRLTAGQLNRATLARQLLLRRESIDAVEAVHRVVALQAQEPASPYLALWNRVAGFDARDLDAAFADHSIVKGQLMRITLHAVDAADYPAFHEAMQATLRAARLNDRRFRRSGLTPSDADTLLPEVLAFAATPRTNAEAEAWLDERIGLTPKPGVWWAFRQFGPLWHHPTGGPWSFGARPSYVAARGHQPPGDPDASMQHMVRRYLEGFGPASVQDIAQFSTIVRPPVRQALAALADSLERFEGPDGMELFDVPGGVLPAADSAAPPRLMAMWDSVLLAYADRGRVVPAEYRRLVMRSNGDVLPTLLVDGLVAGVWRPVDDGIEATAFHRLPDETWSGLETEAAGLLEFLAGRETAVYRRYARWWTALQAAEVRVIGRSSPRTRL